MSPRSAVEIVLTGNVVTSVVPPLVRGLHVFRFIVPAWIHAFSVCSQAHHGSLVASRCIVRSRNQRRHSKPKWVNKRGVKALKSLHKAREVYPWHYSGVAVQVLQIMRC